MKQSGQQRELIKTGEEFLRPAGREGKVDILTVWEQQKSGAPNSLLEEMMAVACTRVRGDQYLNLWTQPRRSGQAHQPRKPRRAGRGFISSAFCALFCFVAIFVL